MSDPAPARSGLVQRWESLEGGQQTAIAFPALVVVLSSPVPEHKIPLWEQELSAGAAAMNLLLATHAMGFVGGWITGWTAYSEMVRAAFCAPGERIECRARGDGTAWAAVSAPAPGPSSWVVVATCASERGSVNAKSNGVCGFGHEGCVVVRHAALRG